MRIWMEEHYGEKDHFALKITLYLLLLLAFAITMPVGVTWLALYFKWPITEVTLITCIVDVILVVWLARECGHRVHRYCTVFCQDDRGGLFAVDIGKFAGYSRGLTGYIIMLRNMQRVVKNMKERHVLERYMVENKSLNGLETEILSVYKMRPVRLGFKAVCRVKYRNGRTGKKKYLLVSGYENEAELISAFERKMSSSREE